ncbi:putative pentatricopeptide [Rosa chinensis]|uniref:Putative pentatricopeptide n=2 Tax=Rosa chinensis TaxID=74649 RepID=A0A2P6PGX0_ROSCH|nr:putative pentatricopeptide [Rosa chinensis]
MLKCSSDGTQKKLANKMYNALVEDGNVNEAFEFYNTIQETGTEPLILIHTSVIKTYLEFGKTRGALEAYLAMLAAGVAPNSYTCTVLIKGLSAEPNFLGDAKKFLLEMMDRGKRPNAATFTAVIEGFAKPENKAAEEEGKEFVQVMIDKGFVPNAKAMMDVLKGRPTSVIRSALVLFTLKQ